MDTLTQEISARFADIASDAHLLAECVAVCKNYALSAEDLQYKWEALNFRPSATRSEISPYTIESLATLKQMIQRERAAATKAPPRTSALVAGINRNALGRNRNKAAATTNGIQAQVKIEPDADGYAMFAGPSTVAFRGPSADPAARKKRAYRYMLEKPSERGDVLDSRIDEFAEQIREHYNVPELGDPTMTSEESITAVGRIVHDSEVQLLEGLSENAVALECSRMLGNGKRVPLRFDWDLKVRGGPQGGNSAVFFPGALVALRGKNGSGEHFQVAEVLILPPPPPLTSPVKFEPEPGFSVLIASGPYTADTDLGFKPWRALVKKIQEAKPTVVLLLGPFIDASHQSIKAGDVDSTPLNLFRTRFTDPLRAYLDSAPGSIALVIPSVRDLNTCHAVFPQGEFAAEVARGDPRIYLLPNPAWFTLNDVSFATTSVDVPYHIKKGELTKTGQALDVVPAASPEDTGTDMMGNFMRHILQQRSFYPVFPVPDSLTSELPLDVTHSDGLRLGPDPASADEGAPLEERAPDVLIVPTRLGRSEGWTRMVHATAALNPSSVVKGAYIVLDVARREAGVAKPRLMPKLGKLE